jgi:hypothetical protein
MSKEHGARLWRIAPQITGGLAVIGTLAGALFHGKFEVWEVAYYLGMAVMMGLVAWFPAAILAAAATSVFDDADEDITWIACVVLCGAVLTVLLAGVYGPDKTDTFAHVAFSAIGIGGLGYAFYKADEAKTKEKEAATAEAAASQASVQGSTSSLQAPRRE